MPTTGIVHVYNNLAIATTLAVFSALGVSHGGDLFKKLKGKEQ